MLRDVYVACATKAGRIDYAYEDDNPQALPTRIIADRAKEFVELRLRIEAWRGRRGRSTQYYDPCGDAIALRARRERRNELSYRNS